MSKYSTMRLGRKYSPSFKLYVTEGEEVISPFHDVPLYVGSSREVVHVVNEIPRFENAKFEISKEERFNPIKQDVKKGKPRFVRNVFPTRGYLWNYGALPQTWEDPREVDKDVGAKGDNDPVDVIEIGRMRKEVGEVYRAKIVGCIALIDEDECDWKVVVIDVEDEKANEINGIEDVQRVYKGLLESTTSWFRDYKVPDGKGRNSFALDGRYMDKEFAMEVVKRAHESWSGMINSKEDVGICRDNSTLAGKCMPPSVVPDFQSDDEVPGYVHEFEFIEE